MVGFTPEQPVMARQDFPGLQLRPRRGAPHNPPEAADWAEALLPAQQLISKMKKAKSPN